MSYYDEKGLLGKIETGLPLLTIFVPDWTWIANDAFGLSTWDLSIKEVGVSLPLDNGKATIYKNGVADSVISSGEIPTTPVLIVKNNERIINTPGTKGLDPVYSFWDDCFDNRNGR